MAAAKSLSTIPFFMIMIIWVVKFSRDVALKGNYCIYTILVPSRQKLGTILENKMFRKKSCKNVNNKKCAPELILESDFRFWHYLTHFL